MMKYNVINIDVDYEAMGIEKSPRQTTLTSYILEEEHIMATSAKKRPAVIVCPGGGYACTSPREAEPIALKFCSAGYHSFILDYSVSPSGWPAPTCELSKAVAYVRSIADDNNIDKDKVFVCGFSAGGHLAASIGVHYNHSDIIKFADVDGVVNKPNGIILGYPVITGKEEVCHKGSIDTFAAGREEIKPLASLENYVTGETPRMFIWHTCTDAGVPVQNTLLLTNALAEKGVNFELHIYPTGPHGLSLGNWQTNPDGASLVVPEVQNWIDMAIRWIENF